MAACFHLRGHREHMAQAPCSSDLGKRLFLSSQNKFAEVSVELCALRVLGLCFGFLSQKGTVLSISVFQFLRGCISVVRNFCKIQTAFLIQVS